MEWVEVTGRTVEEAKEAALDQLGVDEREAEFEILEERRPGLFGRLRSEARVRARVLPTIPRPKVDRRPRRRDRSRRPATQARGARTAGPDTVSDDGGEEMGNGPTLDEEAEAAAEFLDGLVRAFGVECTVERRTIDDETVELAVQGEELGLLIGPRGQTLAAIQHVMSRIDTVLGAANPSATGKRIDTLSTNMAKLTEQLSQASNTLNGLLTKMNRGDGTLGKLASDTTLYNDLHQTLTALTALLTDLKERPGRYMNVKVF